MQMNRKERESKYKWHEIKWQIEYTGEVTDVVSPKPRAASWPMPCGNYSTFPLHPSRNGSGGNACSGGWVGRGDGGAQEQIPQRKRVASTTSVYRPLQNQSNIFHSLVNHHAEAVQDKWIFSVVAG